LFNDNKANYKNATPSNIKIVPTNELNNSFKADYEEMTKSMIVGNAPSYEELILTLGEIQIILKNS